MRNLLSKGLALGLPAVLMALAGCAASTPGVAGDSMAGARGSYEVWVTSESADELARVRFDAEGARVETTRRVGTLPTEIDGPHGVAVSRDGRFVYVTIAHGTPFGTLWKIDARTEEVVARTVLGRFPATVGLTPDGEFGFVANFNLHGDHVPSSISKVHLPTMAEVARTETCVMPHGSRVNPQGTRQYSVCMMDEVLVEIDVGTAEVARTFGVGRGAEGPLRELPPPHAAHHGHDAGAELCSPTWAEPGADGSRVYVTCNQAREVLEIDVEDWTLMRRFATGELPYNAGVTPDGRYLLVTLRNRTDPALEVFDLESGEPVGRVGVSTVLAHGVAVSADSRYAFVSVEGVGAELGKVDVIDLRALRRVASVEVGQQATGIAMAP